MKEQPVSSEVERAFSELREYLSDLIPPLVMLDSMEVLMTCSPDTVASHVNAWASNQFRPGSNLTRADYLFHALKKIHIMSEYRLVSQKDLANFLNRMKPHILNACPQAERIMLAESLERLDDATEPGTSSQVEVVYRQTSGAGSGKSSAQPASENVHLESEVSRIGHMLERIKKDLETIGRGAESVPEEKQEEVLAQVLAQTARSARASLELDEALAYMKRMGISAGTEDVFRALGKNVPEWSLMPRPDLQMPEDSNLKAMHRIVTQANDPKEGATRFHQMVRAAIERLNDGHLHAAANMIELAEKIIAAKEVDPNIAENLRRRGHEDVDLERLRKYADSPDQHYVLRKVFCFFDALTPEGMLDALRTEPRRERRRLFLSLLECHGDAARKVVLSHLNRGFSPSLGEPETFYRRNLLYLLRRIPPNSEENLDELIRIVSQHTDLDFPVIVTREAVACLGQIKHRSVEEVLMVLLQESENRLLTIKNNEDAKVYWALLDRIAASIARVGSPSARRALIEHALSKKPKWGNTVARLSEFGSQDLIEDPMTIRELVAAVHANLPKKVLGLFSQHKDQDLKVIVEALAGTTSPDVRHLLQDLSRKYPDIVPAHPTPRPSAAQDPVVLPQQKASVPVAAAPVAAITTTAPVASSSLNGDLDLFGLPGLLQSLGDHNLSGTLTLRDPQGSVFATADFSSGKLVSAHFGQLSNETAIYQLLEHPSPGTFQFSKGGTRQDGVSKEVLPLLMEGIRRYDELQQMEAILPAKSRLATTGTKPTVHPEEKDGLLFRDLWNAVRQGATPQDCEAKVACDSYRIRRLLVHWVEAGSIKSE